ncbi:MAG: CotH kinase family protein [Alistipes sp.]|nr:CotH kinase family protein [Alistipes sp.]
MRRAIRIFYFSIVLLSALFAWVCTPDVGPEPINPEEGGNSEELFDPNVDLPIEPYSPYYPSSEWAEEELAKLFDMGAFPKIHIEVSLSEWQRLLQAFDRWAEDNTYIHCDVDIELNGQEHSFSDAGLRIRGYSSRRRPESREYNDVHNADKTYWQQSSFMLNLRKYQKDDAHELYNVRKINLRHFFQDATCCRELFCYDLLHRFGIWTAPYSSYCRLWIHVNGDSKPAYFGVYGMVEPVDDKYIKRRKELFGDHKHNLWKCHFGAHLNYDTDNGALIYFDEDLGINYHYELKSNIENFDVAKAQLVEFMRKISEYEGEEFHNWITSVCDVELLLRTYAVNVAVGNWDDYWVNSNNYYLYFNTSDIDQYEVFFIPCDFDQTLGSGGCSRHIDVARQNPLMWGDSKANPLIAKLLEFDDLRAIYVEALKELCSEQNDLMHYTRAIPRIKQWHRMIEKYLPNDTGENCEIVDTPGRDSNPEYRILDESPDVNFFRLKADVISAM